MPYFRSPKLLVLVIVILVLATSAYAFAATNNVPANRDSKSSGVRAGYNVSNISYAFDTASPSNLTTVAFDLDNPASTVKVSVAETGTLQNCTSATPFTHWSCTLTGVTITGKSFLRVVATK